MPVESDDELREILAYETIAVVGCSATPHKDAHAIPKYMRRQGYEIVPVNPYADEIFGLETYDALAAVDADVDIVNVFRPSEEVSEIASEAIERDDVEVVWTQLGIRDADAGDRIEAAGKRYVEDRCLKVEHRRLL
jgi:predicted CoA-binding protein